MPFLGPENGITSFALVCSNSRPLGGLRPTPGFRRWGSHHPLPSPLAARLSKEKSEDEKMSHEQGRHNRGREVERRAESPRLNLGMRSQPRLQEGRGATIRRDLIDVAARTARHGRCHITLDLPEGWHASNEWLTLSTAACGLPAAAA